MEDDLNIFENGRRPQSFFKWKTTSILLKMEEDLILFVNGRIKINYRKNNENFNIKNSNNCFATAPGNLFYLYFAGVLLLGTMYT
jgi:hypothetical protein